MSAIIFNGKDAKLLTGRDLLDSSGNAYAKGQEKTYTAAACRASKWSTSGAGVTIADDTTAADLPRAITSPIGQKITGVSGSTDYAYYRFTLDPADYNTKLKVQLAINPLSGYVSNDFKIDVYSNTASAYNGTSTRLALSTDTSSVTGIPNATGTFRTTFDAPGSAAPYIELRIGLNGTNTHSLVISDVIVGPGTVVQGAALSDWATYTPTFGAGFGTAANISFSYRRVGSAMEIIGNFTVGTAAGTVPSFTLPTGCTINTAVVTASKTKLGEFNHLTANSYVTNSAASQVGQKLGVLFYSAAVGTSAVAFATQVNGSGVFRDDAGTDVSATGENISVKVLVPINEWAGSGTVNVAQNDVEYAYNTNTADAADSTSFGYGPAGVAFGAFTAARTKTVQFQTPISSTDRVTLEIQTGSGAWSSPNGWDPNSGISQYVNQNAATYGMGIQTGTSSTQVIVAFGTYTGPTAGYGGAGNPWSGVSGWKWRLRKERAGAAVGWGAATDSSSGLVSGESYGNFTGTLTGFTAGVTTTITWARIGKAVVLSIAAQSGTSNATTFTITGLPSALIPANDQDGLIDVVDSGTTSTGKLRVKASTGIIEVYKATFSAFTASGSKGFSGHNQTFTYVLI